MNVTGPSGGASAAYRLPPPTRPTPPAPAASTTPAVEVGRLPAGSRAPSDDVPVPPGSDPALWRVLTSEERHFFARQAALGPISYGPRSTAPMADAPLGQRIDVRA